MRFFGKDPDSPLRALKYAPRGHNDALLDGLVREQRGFCAYTERRFNLQYDTLAVEHFDRTLKGGDDDGYENYYAVLQSVNQLKRRKEREYAGAGFFQSKFFQRPGGFEARIAYVPGEFVYEEVATDDTEAKEFIDYLGLSDSEIAKSRRKHLEHLRGIFNDASYDGPPRLAYFTRNPQELHYLTVLEAELEIELGDAIPLDE